MNSSDLYIGSEFSCEIICVYSLSYVHDYSVRVPLCPSVEMLIVEIWKCRKIYWSDSPRRSLSPASTSREYMAEKMVSEFICYLARVIRYSDKRCDIGELIFYTRKIDSRVINNNLPLYCEKQLRINDEIYASLIYVSSFVAEAGRSCRMITRLPMKNLLDNLVLHISFYIFTRK